MFKLVVLLIAVVGSLGRKCYFCNLLFPTGANVGNLTETIAGTFSWHNIYAFSSFHILRKVMVKKIAKMSHLWPNLNFRIGECSIKHCRGRCALASYTTEGQRQVGPLPVTELAYPVSIIYTILIVAVPSTRHPYPIGHIVFLIP